MNGLVLSLFPGIGLLDMAFEQEGFCVVRGPDVLWGGDIQRFRPPAGRFDGVVAGPPCQAFLPLSNINRHQWGDESVMPNLIPEFERTVLAAQPDWFVMENVPQAPVPSISGYDVHPYILNNRQCLDDDGNAAVQNRVRLFSWGWKGHDRPALMIDVCLWDNPVWERAAIGGSGGTSLGAVGWDGFGSTATKTKADRKRRSFSELCRLQGLPDGFDLPPFTEAAKCKAIGNGVPLPMGRAIAKAVKAALSPPDQGDEPT